MGIHNLSKLLADAAPGCIKGSAACARRARRERESERDEQPPNSPAPPTHTDEKASNLFGRKIGVDASMALYR